MSLSSVSVQVPATTANLGPGFDCLGVALELYNQFHFTRFSHSHASPVEITVKGDQEQKVTLDEDNLLYRAFAGFYERFGETPPTVKIEIDLGVPLSRGLGSSATAIIGGLLGANALAGYPLESEDLLKMAIDVEGHPDNIVPAFKGGCQLAVRDHQNWEISEIPWSEAFVPVVAIPDFELSTAKARSILPTKFDREVTIFNASHLGLLLRAIESGRSDWLRIGMQDQLHQPYRQELIVGYTTVEAAALSAGAYGLAISGAGPTLLALTSPANASVVAQEMQTAWEKHQVTAQVKTLNINTTGATIH